MAKQGRSREIEDRRARSIVAFGANLPSPAGSPLETLERAVELLSEAGVEIVARSRWYSTPAWPSGAGPDYVNGVAEVSFDGGSLALLHVLQAVETLLGRVRGAGAGDRWRARVCDLDLICQGSEIVPDLKAWHAARDLPAEGALPELVLPHPRMQGRAFVLAPMAEIAGAWRHPVLGDTVEEMLAALPAEERAEIRPFRSGETA